MTVLGRDSRSQVWHRRKYLQRYLWACSHSTPLSIGHNQPCHSTTLLVPVLCLEEMSWVCEALAYLSNRCRYATMQSFSSSNDGGWQNGVLAEFSCCSVLSVASSILFDVFLYDCFKFRSGESYRFWLMLRTYDNYWTFSSLILLLCPSCHWSILARSPMSQSRHAM